MLVTTMKSDKIEVTTEVTGALVATITYNRGAWLVMAEPDYMHGSSTQWWRSLKAAEYHALAIYEDYLAR